MRPFPRRSLQVGLFGSVTALRAHPPSRGALFDTALAGPAAGGLASLATLASGLILTAAGPAPGALAGWPVLPVALLKSSSLVSALALGLCPDALQGVTAAVHPLVVGGLVGTVVNALQLLPIGRTDGGRSAHAEPQSRRVAPRGAQPLTAARATLDSSARPLRRLSQALLGPNGGPRALSAVTLLGLALCSAFSQADQLFVYGAFVALLQGRQEVACLDEVTPIGQFRAAAAFGVGSFVILALLPLPTLLDPFPSAFGGALG